MNILLVRLRLIGDVLFTTPAIRALRRRFPDARIDYLVEPAAAPIVAHNPHLDHVYTAPMAHGLERVRVDLALGRRLRADRYDAVLDFHGGPRSSLLTWMSRAPMRVGYRVIGRTWVYTHRIDRPRALRARHSVENQWDLLAPFGIDPPDRSRDAMEMLCDPAADAAITARLTRAGSSPSDRLVVIHVAPGNPFRRWPEAGFEALGVALAHADARVRLVFTSGPSDAAAARRIGGAVADRIKPRDRIVIEGDELTLDELRALIGRAALFIGGDSGPLHIAACTETPVVGLYGPTLPARSAPWRSTATATESLEVVGLTCRPCNQRRCIPGDFRCLTGLTPDVVTAAALRALSLRPPV